MRKFDRTFHIKYLLSYDMHAAVLLQSTPLMSYFLTYVFGCKVKPY